MAIFGWLSRVIFRRKTCKHKPKVLKARVVYLPKATARELPLS
jgi:hypothetical protein